MNQNHNTKSTFFLITLIFFFIHPSTILAGKRGLPSFPRIIEHIQEAGLLTLETEEHIKGIFKTYGNNPDITFNDGNTFLHYSVMSLGDSPVSVFHSSEDKQKLLIIKELIAFLLGEGASVNIPNDQQQTPFSIAAINKQYPIILLFLEHSRSEPNYQDNETGLTHLHLAAQINDLDLIEILFSHGAAIMQDKQGKSPLFYAVTNKNPDITRYLFQKSSCQDIVQTIHLIADLHSSEMLNFYASIIKQSNKQTVLLEYATQTQDAFACSFLLEQGANPHEPNKQGFSPFFYALQQRNMELAKLLKGNTDVNTLLVNRHPLLHEFTVTRYYEHMKFLIELGADPLVKDGQGRSALAYAAYNRDETAVRILNQHQEIERDTVDDKPLILFFIDTNNEKVIRFLHKLKISTSLEDDKGETSAIHMMQNRQWNLLVETFEWSSKPSPAIDAEPLESTESSSKKGLSFKQSLRSQINIEATDSNGRTMLHDAVLDNHPGGVAILLELGSDPRSCDKEGNAPIHFAVHHKEITVLTMLYNSCPISIRFVNEQLQTPLHVACIHENVPAVRFLLARDPDTIVDLKDKNHKTPLNYAYAKKNLELAKCIIRAWILNIIENRTDLSCFFNEIKNSVLMLKKENQHTDFQAILSFCSHVNDFLVDCIEEDCISQKMPAEAKEEYLKELSTFFKKK